MKLRHTAGEPVVDSNEGDLAISATGVSKYFASDEVPYAPATSIFARFRRAGPPLGVESVIGDDDDGDDGGDDDDDFDDIDEQVEELPPVGETDSEGRWALRGVSFEVPPGGSLGVIGARGAGRSTLIRILGRVVPPTSGTVVLRGRIAPTTEFAMTFVRLDLDVVANAEMLARLLRVPRSERQEYVRAVTSLVFGPDARSLPPSLDQRLVTRRIALATALDPGADIVLLDELGIAGDVAFYERCIERLDDLRAGGVTLVLASQDIPLVRRFCEQAIALEDGEIVAAGAVADVVVEYRRRRALNAAKHGRRRDATLHSFSGEAAILGVDVVTVDGGQVSAVRSSDSVVVRIELETANIGIFALPSLRFRAGRRGVSFEQSEPSLLVEPTRYMISAVIPAAALPAGQLVIDVEAEIDHDGGRSVIGRFDAASITVDSGSMPDPDGSLEVVDEDDAEDAFAETVSSGAEWIVEPL